MQLVYNSQHRRRTYFSVPAAD